MAAAALAVPGLQLSAAPAPESLLQALAIQDNALILLRPEDQPLPNGNGPKASAGQRSYMLLPDKIGTADGFVPLSGNCAAKHS